jgi:hypothetical protein
MEFLLEQQANFVGSEAAAKERHDREIAEIRQIMADTQEIGRQTRLELRRAVRLGVQEARAERKRRKEEDAKLAASQAALEASLKAYFDSLKRGQNGHENG